MKDALVRLVKRQADPRRLSESLADFAIPVPGLDLNLVDLRVEYLQIVEQSVDQPPEAAGRLLNCILDEIMNAVREVREALRHDQAELSLQPKYLVGLRGSSLNKPLPGPV